MRQTTHTTQVFAPFGTGYVVEAHGSGNLGYEPRTQRSVKWVVVVGILMLGATTAGAVAAAQRSHPAVPKLWLQPMPAILMNLADVGRVEQNLF